jgi:glycosyltransferase involved in cell wall biosynthesis
MVKNILMICYYYPPLQDVGCKRSVAFSYYFKKHGWNPYVLSVKNPDKTFCTIGDDSPPEGVYIEYSYSVINPYKFIGIMNAIITRLASIFGIKITRNYLYDIFCIPDLFWGWIPITVIKGLFLIKRFHIDTIYISCSPFSSAIIGVLLKLFSGKQLILDFRDPFALAINSIMGVPKPRRILNKFLEKWFINKSDIFIVTTEELKKEYINQYPWIKDKIYAVHNGFDANFLYLNKKEKFSKFTIIYTGDFYDYALPLKVFTDIFFGAISFLKNSGKISNNNFQFLFYGQGKQEVEKVARDLSIQDLVITSSRIPYEQVLNIVSRSHLQLLRIVKPMISTKLYEGISLNIPFIATIPHGEVEKMIKKYSPSSSILNEESTIEDVANAIIDVITHYNNNTIKDNSVNEFLENFSREKLSQKLIQLIEWNL